MNMHIKHHLKELIISVPNLYNVLFRKAAVEILAVKYMGKVSGV